MRGRWFIILGAIFGGLSVVAGAFGAHALEGQVTPKRLAAFETAARYQMYHALALVLIGMRSSTRPRRPLDVAGLAMLAGVLLFSGSLYTLVLTDTGWLGAITPLGGLSFLVGWTALAIDAARA